MTELEQDIIWTIMVDKKLDTAVQNTIQLLGYTDKVELVREAIREFLNTRKHLFLNNSEPAGSICPQKINPANALHDLSKLLQKIPRKVLDEEIAAAREDV